MLETLLSYGGDAKKSQLTSALYYRDQADRTDSVTFDANGISGLKTRKTFTTTSNPVDMIGRIPIMSSGLLVVVNVLRVFNPELPFASKTTPVSYTHLTLPTKRIV